MYDPQQEMFSKLKKELEAKGFAVYDGCLPPEGTPYPFVYLGDSRQTDDDNKTAVFGDVYQTIHVWHNNHRQRGTVSQILLEIKLSCRMISHTDHFAWDVRNITQQIFPDNTTNQPLLHGVLNVEWKFS
jgi:hypothetical protein